MLRGVAKWISWHTRGRCTISRRDFRDRQSQVVASAGGIIGVIWSDGRGRWRQRIAGFMHQTFSSSKYGKSFSRNDYYIIAFKNPRDQLAMKNLLLQAFPTFWQDMMDVYQIVRERPFGYMVLDLHPASNDRRLVFSHLLTHEGYPSWHHIKTGGCLTYTNQRLNLLSSFEAHCLGWRSTREEKRPWEIAHQTFLTPRK